MNIRIEFHLIHSFFRDPFVVKVDWNFPFLPRTGEYINPWIWIEENHIKESAIKPLLTEEALNNLKEERYTLNDWLYEVGIECNEIESVSYYKDDAGELYVKIFLSQKTR